MAVTALNQSKNLLYRPALSRGKTSLDWLQSYHSFSFGDYQDAAWMGFRRLRVLNDDYVTGGAGFHPHSHRDMEIISVVLAGDLHHQDSAGHKGSVKRGDVQYMSAGSGIQHSEFNGSTTDPVHFWQIWLLPDNRGTKPNYQQHSFDFSSSTLSLAASGIKPAPITLPVPVSLYTGQLKAGSVTTLPLDSARHAWVQVANGTLVVNGQTLGSGDGIGISQTNGLSLQATSAVDVLVLDLD